MLVWLLAGVLLSAPPDVVAVCPRAFQSALRPWVEYRTAQGYTVEVLSAGPSADVLRAEIRRVAAGGRLRFVVLVGDIDPTFGESPAWAARTVPVHREKAVVNVLWGSAPHIAADNYYSDLDDDGLPDVAIGRLSADTPDELATMVRKIIAYEQSSDLGTWRRQVNLVAGVGGFGVLADLVLESTTRYFITRGIPAWCATSMTYANWRSPYCPDPRLFADTVVERLNEGSLLWVYIGHGFHTGLDRVQTPAGTFHILSTNDMDRLRCRHGAPIAVYLACYTGAFDAVEDCLAECMLREPGGPVAVLAGSRVTMPYAMCVLANGLLEECFEKQAATLGEAVMRAKRAMAQSPTGQVDARAMLDTLAAALSPAAERLAEERQEHIHLFNLLGDPLTRLRHPKKVDLVLPDEANPGGTIALCGHAPVAGRCIVELAAPCGVLPFRPPGRGAFPAEAGLEEFQQVYARANNPRLSSVEFQTTGGRFEAALPVPAEAHGRSLVRVYIEGAGEYAAGCGEVNVVEVRRTAE